MQMIQFLLDSVWIVMEMNEINQVIASEPILTFIKSRHAW